MYDYEHPYNHVLCCAFVCVCVCACLQILGEEKLLLLLRGQALVQAHVLVRKGDGNN